MKNKPRLPHTYILKGKEVIAEPDLSKWEYFFEQAWKENKRYLRYNKIRNITISTIFDGIDHNYSRGELAVFETMIFGGEHDQYTDRYPNWESALAGHRVAMRLVIKSLRSQDGQEQQAEDLPS